MEQLFSKGFVKTISDIYALTEKELFEVEGFKEKSVYNLMQSIEVSKKCSLAKFILALGIKYVGEGTAEALAKKAENIETLSKMTQEELMQVEGVGEKVAESVSEYFLDPHHQKH